MSSCFVVHGCCQLHGVCGRTCAKCFAQTGARKSNVDSRVSRVDRRACSQQTAWSLQLPAWQTVILHMVCQFSGSRSPRPGATCASGVAFCAASGSSGLVWSGFSGIRDPSGSSGSGFSGFFRNPGSSGFLRVGFFRVVGHPGFSGFLASEHEHIKSKVDSRTPEVDGR